jgi:plasmid replication initiation protein
MLGVPESYVWGMFEKKVLNVAIAELLEKSNIHISIARQKTNRKITHLKIEFMEIQKHGDKDPNTTDWVDEFA